ncbi:hypothetical protein ElyMa_003194100 [Elysia marginata]|uniref:Reverse transcriptase domain-containing protein n=1 Tax=Elysia marginata TaxID=1093978 RepID=A0AAV4J229_9GAST|nr:hypothetical protein ElyMa_003194100 [Elysia marginata]
MKRTTLDTLHDHHTSISIGGRPVYNFRFADDIDLIGCSNNELLENDILDTSASAYGSEDSTKSRNALIPFRKLGFVTQRSCIVTEQRH